MGDIYFCFGFRACLSVERSRWPEFLRKFSAFDFRACHPVRLGNPAFISHAVVIVFIIGLDSLRGWEFRHLLQFFPTFGYFFHCKALLVCGIRDRPTCFRSRIFI